jgi:hypothetical protein
VRITWKHHVVLWIGSLAYGWTMFFLGAWWNS